MLERRYKVMKLRKDGLPLHEIAAILDCAPETIRNDIRDVMGKTAQEMLETADEARVLERARYEAMIKVYQPAAEAGNMAAAQLILNISRELRKMEAIDKPEEKKTEESGVRVYVGIDIDQV